MEMLNKLAQLQHSSFHAMSLCRAVYCKRYTVRWYESLEQDTTDNDKSIKCRMFRPEGLCQLHTGIQCMQICSENWILQIHKDTLKQAHTTLVLVIPLPRLGYMDPINGVSQQVATRPVAPLAVETPAYHPSHMAPSVQ